MSWQAKLLIFLMKFSAKPALGVISMSAFSMRVLRFLFAALASILPVPKFVAIEKVNVDGVPAEWVSAGNQTATGIANDKVILYFHGGGYFCGSPKTHRPITWRLARNTGMKVLAIDYRMSPEFSIPISMLDAISSYRWLLQQGYKAHNITLGGDSAGGNLTLITTLEIRNQALPMPAAIFCISPFADLTATSPSLIYNAKSEALIHHKGLRKIQQKLCNKLDSYDPQISPVYADYHNFPPIFLQVGSTEVLLDDSNRVAERARQAGVLVVQKVWINMPHVFTILADFMPEGKRGLREIAEFIIDYTGYRAVNKETAEDGLSVDHLPIDRLLPEHVVIN